MKNLLPIVFTALALNPLAHASSTTSPVFEKDADSVVRIYSEAADSNGFDPAKLKMIGSGFHLGHGVIATGPDMIEDGSQVLVVEAIYGSDGQPKFYAHRASVVGADPVKGIAMLQCSDMHSPGLESVTKAPAVGDAAYYVGFADTDIKSGEAMAAAIAPAVNPGWDKQASFDVTSAIVNAGLQNALHCVAKSVTIKKFGMDYLSDPNTKSAAIETDFGMGEDAGSCPLVNADGQVEGLYSGETIMPDGSSIEVNAPVPVVADQINQNQNQ